MLAEYKLTKDANLEALDAAVAGYEQRRAAAGVTALQNARDAANDAEEEALTAVCAFQCRTLEEVRIKGAHLLAHHERICGLTEDDITPLLQSLAGG